MFWHKTYIIWNRWKPEGVFSLYTIQCVNYRPRIDIVIHILAFYCINGAIFYTKSMRMLQFDFIVFRFRSSSILESYQFYYDLIRKFRHYNGWIVWTFLIITIGLFCKTSFHLFYFIPKWHINSYVCMEWSYLCEILHHSLTRSDTGLIALLAYFINIMNICHKLMSSVSLAYKHFNNTCFIVAVIFFLFCHSSVQCILIDLLV